MVVPLQEFVFVIVGSVVLSLIVVAALLPWARETRRLVLISAACVIGIIVWNVGLNVASATAFNVDTDILGLSVQDVGSGVLAFVATFLALALGDRGQQIARVLSASAIVGLITVVVDRFG
jgi:hypothetical protein